MQVQAIGRQWFSVTSLDNSFYSEQIALSRTFCIYEEVGTKFSSITSLAITFCLLLKYVTVASNFILAKSSVLGFLLSC